MDEFIADAFIAGFTTGICAVVVFLIAGAVWQRTLAWYKLRARVRVERPGMVLHSWDELKIDE